MPSARSLSRANTLTGEAKAWYLKLINGRPRVRGVPIETWTLIQARIDQTPTTNCQAPPFLALYGYDIRAECRDTSASPATPSS